MVVTLMILTSHLIRFNPSLDGLLSVFCPQSNMIINTAILTNQPVSLPVIVLAISHDGKVSDVTSAVTCLSTNENTIKV